MARRQIRCIERPYTVVNDPVKREKLTLAPLQVKPSRCPNPRGHYSPIEKIIPGEEICISGAWLDTTFRFKPKGNTKTIVEVVESDPKAGASFSDGGAANKANWERQLRKLKECIENETYPEKRPAASPAKKWWEFWK